MKIFLKKLLILAGISNIFVGMVHIVMLFLGVGAFSYLGAPASLIHMVEKNEWVLVTSIMILLASLFIIAGLYALSAAEVIHHLPASKTILLALGLVYCLRGAVVVLWPFPLVAESLMHRYPALLGMGRPILWQDWFFFTNLVAAWFNLHYKLVFHPKDTAAHKSALMFELHNSYIIL